MVARLVTGEITEELKPKSGRTKSGKAGALARAKSYHPSKGQPSPILSLPGPEKCWASRAVIVRWADLRPVALSILDPPLTRPLI